MNDQQARYGKRGTAESNLTAEQIQQVIIKGMVAAIHKDWDTVTEHLSTAVMLAQHAKNHEKP